MNAPLDDLAGILLAGIAALAIAVLCAALERAWPVAAALWRALATPLPDRPFDPVTFNDVVIDPGLEDVIRRRLAEVLEIPVRAPRAVITGYPGPVRACPLCDGTGSDDCACASPCGYPTCQALDPEAS